MDTSGIPRAHLEGIHGHDDVLVKVICEVKDDFVAC